MTRGPRRAAARLTALIAAALVLFWTPAAFAQSGGPTGDDGGSEAAGGADGIDVHVRGGAGRELTAVAVPDTLEQGGGTDGIADDVEKTLRRDLELSGFFKVLPSDSFFFDPADEAMGPINFENWSNVGAQALVKSAVKLDKGRVLLDLRAYGVDGQKRLPLKWSAEPAGTSDYTAQVHGFVNALIEYYTGKPGIFGTKIAYVQRNKSGLKQVYVMEMDGSHRAAITKNNSINLLPAWGPGGVLYYTSYKGGNPDLYKYTGGKHTKLSSRRGQNTGPAHCGGKLAVTLSMGGENADIYLIDPGSGEIEKRLTDHWAIDTSPTWSPDCSKIAFVSSRSGGPQIYVMSANGSGVKRLTYQGGYNTQPDWSPDGSVIVFSGRDERNHYDLFTVDLDGSITRLTQDQGNNQDPSFSPDGRYVVFVSDRGGKGKRVFLMTSDGEVQKPITDDGGYGSPTWNK